MGRRGRLRHLLLKVATAVSLAIVHLAGCATRHASSTATEDVPAAPRVSVREEFARRQLENLHVAGFWPADHRGWSERERAAITATLPALRSTLGERWGAALPLYQVVMTGGAFRVGVACFERLPDGSLLTPVSPTASFEVSADCTAVRMLGTL